MTTILPSRRRGLVGSLALVAGLSGCGQSSGPVTRTTAPQGTPIVVGASVAVSGQFAANGAVLEQGYRVWADNVNGRGGILHRPVTIDILHDDGGDAQVKASYTRLIEHDHATFVLGPFAETATLAAASVAAAHGMPLIEGSGTGPIMFGKGLTNLFSVSLSGADALSGFGSWLLSLPPGKRPVSAAYVGIDDPYAQPQVVMARQQLERGGIRTILFDTYPVGDPSLPAEARKVAAVGSDVLIVGSLGVAELSEYLAVFKDQHYTPKAWIATAGPDTGGDFLKAFGPSTEAILYANGSWYPGLATFENNDFLQAWVTKVGGSGGDISSDAVQAYSCGQVLKEAIEAAVSTDSSAVMAHLRGDTFKTIQGPARFASDGENAAARPFLFQWQRDATVVVYPPDVAKAQPEYPKPTLGSE